MQLIFPDENEERALQETIDYHKNRIENENLPYDLIAINLFHTCSVVIYDREADRPYSLSIYPKEIKYKYGAHDPDGFGTNFRVIDERFADRQSYHLTNKKKELISRSKPDLEKYIAEGWQVINR